MVPGQLSWYADYASSWQIEKLRLDPRQDLRILLPPKLPDRFWNPQQISQQRMTGDLSHNEKCPSH